MLYYSTDPKVETVVSRREANRQKVESMMPSIIMDARREAKRVRDEIMRPYWNAPDEYFVKNPNAAEKWYNDLCSEYDKFCWGFAESLAHNNFPWLTKDAMDKVKERIYDKL